MLLVSSKFNWITATFLSPTNCRRLKLQTMIKFTITTRKYTLLVIVCFSNRDKRNELNQMKKLLTSTSKTNQAPVTIQENLTSRRKFLLNEAKKAKEYLNFNYIWTSNVKILLRQHSTSKIISVSFIRDLAKLGYIPSSNYVSEPTGKTKVNDNIY